uniref:H15 domain-containing protein n=1 Tax=Angiostrongylus cantonensis TaxID=6313 RepID=A0A0K0DQN1_ANGCA
LSMLEVTAAPATTSTSATMKKTKATKQKGEKKAKTAPTHPVYGTMIKSAIKELKDRKGASKQAILKFIVQKYKVGDNEKQINARLRLALKRGVQSGLLTQASGTGAAGRFRMAERSSHEAAAKIAKKPKNKKLKKEKSSSSPKKATRPKAKSAKSPQKVVMKKAAAKPKLPRKTKKAPPAKA